MNLINQYELKERLKDSNQINVACSGGIDSVSLVYVLGKHSILKSIYHFVYEEPACFVKEAYECVCELARMFEVPLYIKTEKDYIKQRGLLSSNNKENNWREMRYEGMREIYGKNKETICVAHHLDDQRTSYILSLLKKSSRCFIPIETQWKEITIFRPYLLNNVDKAALIEYQQKERFRYVEDPFNVVGDRSTIDLVLPDLMQIKQFDVHFKKQYELYLARYYNTQ